MKKTTFAATAAALLATAGAAVFVAMPAQAQPGPDPMGKGTVSWEQAKVLADTMWTRMDANNDGMLNDADRDSKMAQKFDEIDTSHDGAISRAEFAAHRKAMVDRKGMGHGKGMMGGHRIDGHRMDDLSQDGAPMGRGMKGMGHGGRMMHEMAAMADTNHDNAISRAEFDAAAKARFDKSDADHDGQLTVAERRVAWAGMRKGHGGRRGAHSAAGHGGATGSGMGDDMGDMPPPSPPGA